jgi:hypothetical protein
VVCDYLQRAIESIGSLSVHFVFNTNEIGHQEWPDRHERIYFVPMFHPGDQVGYLLPRAGQPITLLACIVAHTQENHLRVFMADWHDPRKGYDTVIIQR